MVQMWDTNLEEKTDCLTCARVMKGKAQPVLNHNNVGRTQSI